MHTWVNNCGNFLYRRLLSVVDKPSMVLLIVSIKFLYLNFKFIFLKRIGSFHFAIYQCIKKGSPGSIHLWTNPAHISFDNPIQTIFFYLGWVVIILPSSRSSSDYLGVAPIPFFGCLYPQMQISAVKFVK